MNDIDRELLERYAAGDFTEEEKEIIEKWLNADAIADNPQAFEGVDQASLKDEIWSAIGVPVSPVDKKILWPNHLLKVAACLLLCIFVGYGSYRWYQSAIISKDILKIADHNFVAAPGQKTKLTLPDGTIVMLNGDSQLKYPHDFILNGQREVFLKGEAHFSVAKDLSKPFIIHAAGSVTKVLGTVFNIKAYPEEKGTILTVEEGKVQFSEESDSIAHLILTAGKQGIYKAGRPLEMRDVYAAGYTAWKDSEMIIKKQTLQEISLLITRWYGITVEVENSKLSNERFTGVYKNTTLETLAKDISLAFHCNYKLDQKTLIFY